MMTMMILGGVYRCNPNVIRPMLYRVLLNSVNEEEEKNQIQNNYFCSLSFDLTV